MAPLGRTFYKAGAKHKVKHKGKHLKGWWEVVVPASKAKFKRQVRKEIENEKLCCQTCS